MIKRRIAIFLALLMGVPLFSGLASAASEPSAVVETGLAAAAYAYGEHTASAFAGGTVFSVNIDGTATFYVQQPGVYTFYAKDLAGSEVVKTVTLAL